MWFGQQFFLLLYDSLLESHTKIQRVVASVWYLDDDMMIRDISHFSLTSRADENDTQTTETTIEKIEDRAVQIEIKKLRLLSISRKHFEF